MLILGAGAAGLAAAAQLSVAGRRVALIEARRRIGGRIHTEHIETPGAATSTAIELGAEFIHGLPEQSWRLVEEARLATRELDGSRLSYTGGVLQGGVEPLIDGALDDMAQWFARQPGDVDMTFANYLERARVGSTVRAAAIGYVEGFNAADHRVIGLAALDRQQRAEDAIQGDRLFHIVGGYDALPAHLLERGLNAGAQIHLGTVIHTVSWAPGQVAMTGSDGDGNPCTFSGTRAVVTLPLGVLQAGTVRFDPPPAAPLAEARRLAMGSVLRVPLLFKSRFWQSSTALERSPELADDLETLSFLFTDRIIPTWWTPAPDRTPLLTAWVAGPASQLLERERRAAGGARPAVIDRCLGALAEIFSVPTAALQQELQSGHFHDWDADPFARGAYSYAPAGAAEASARMARPVDRTLYFAGEHTTTSGHWATVHGALQSGEAAAAKILEE